MKKGKRERKRKKERKEDLGFAIVDVILGIRLRLNTICNRIKVNLAKVNLETLSDRLNDHDEYATS